MDDSGVREETSGRHGNEGQNRAHIRMPRGCREQESRLQKLMPRCRRFGGVAIQTALTRGTGTESTPANWWRGSLFGISFQTAS